MKWERKFYRECIVWQLHALKKNHKNYIAYILLDENRKICDLQVFEPEEETLLNNIYVGYVEKVVPNIQAAFVRIANGQKISSVKDLRAPVFKPT